MMNGRHLPAGQGMPPDMGRRRQYNQHQHQHQHQQHPHQHQQYPPQMYSTYMPPYAPNYYPQPPPLQYANAPGLHQYAPYPPYVRSPPPLPMQQQYAPMPQPGYPRPQQSPASSTPYQPPPPPLLPHTPSSTQSSYTLPAPLTPSTPQTGLSASVSSPPETETLRIPFRAPLPWLSRPDLAWPTRRTRRKRKAIPQLLAEAVELPDISQPASANTETPSEVPAAEIVTPETPNVRSDTPSTSQPPSEEADSTNPTTPSSSQLKPELVEGDVTPTPKISTKSTIPVVPVIPVIPKSMPKDLSKPVVEESRTPAAPVEQEIAAQVPETEEKPAEELTDTPPVPKAWTTPKLWTGLFNPGAATSTAASSESGRAGIMTGSGKNNAESLAEALKVFSATSNESKVAFLEPRGLINTGNMCYMNSVLQVLIFCLPFYNFLDQVSKRAAHSFKSETPLLDAMILFMREYPVIDSAASVEQLRLRLKDGELEQYGEAFSPDFVYNVINRLPRFSSMRRGHQQDAEEFLGFLLEGLHDECVQVMRTTSSNANSAIPTPTNGPSSPVSEIGSVQGSVSGKENGWLEVGPKQKAAVTRSSGTITTGSPLTKIFGGNLRSELRVPGLKDSVTLEPYQPLQLDIGAPNVNNIIDALKGLTRSEPLHGDFKSPKGPDVTANKQVFIETLPPVLILHLKRFQYDNAGGTQKIWKKVGYPLELEIPKEVFPRQKRAAYAHSGLPKYRLIAAVYHHGKNASGGHYTVDVRRQDGREWIRLDDTVIRRVRSEEVAEAGSEEDPKVLAAALEAQKKDSPVSGNGFSAIEGADEEADEDGWKKASGPGKKWSSVVNGTTTPKPKTDKFSVKDNKVAYLLFYQKI